MNNADFPRPLVPLDLIKKAFALYEAAEQLSQLLWDTFGDEFILLDNMPQINQLPLCDLPHEPLPF
ncbi:MAG: hypothetical protein JW795_22620 [Chitinivibrionales bacterium]|nr:hypothetical protein [Chitinivibrionales bacterium]